MMEDVRYFVVSDLHGDGIMYYQIIHYLENLWNNYHGKIILYIIGDVVDRGPDSMNILFDIMKRSIAHRGKILVQLLAGNHEYMMYEVSLEKCELGNNIDLKFEKLIKQYKDKHLGKSIHDFYCINLLN